MSDQPIRCAADETAACMTSTPPAGKPQESGWLLWGVVSLLVFNVLDAMLTVYAVNAGIASEANILWQTLVISDPAQFVLLKVLLVSLGAALLWRLRSHCLAAAGIVLTALAYTLVIVVHVLGLLGS